MGHYIKKIKLLILTQSKVNEDLVSFTRTVFWGAVVGWWISVRKFEYVLIIAVLFTYLEICKALGENIVDVKHVAFFPITVDRNISPINV
jgi:hypothetical protein